MILSRLIAKQRIATKTQPSFIGAWGLVAADALILGLLIMLLYGPLRYGIIALDIPMFMIILAAVLLIFIPMQAVLIISALWAAKSRWVDTDEQH